MPAKSFSAGGVVINKHGEVLVVNQNGNSWSLPKGHIDQGESARQAAAREIREESGIQHLEYVKDLGSYERNQIGLEGHGETDEIKSIELFLYSTDELTLRPEDPHNPEARWVPPEDVVLLLTHPKDKAFFAALIPQLSAEKPSMMDAIVSGYIKLNPREVVSLGQLIEQVANDEKLNDRHNFNGHITGSAIVLSPDRKQILLIYHKLFDRWQQPGGHWESDEETDPLAAAQREAEEETGVTIAAYLPVHPDNPLVPLDIDSHLVPARPAKDEPGHFHHDFRYVFVAATMELKHQVEEVDAAEWFALDASECAIIQRTLTKLYDSRLV